MRILVCGGRNFSNPPLTKPPHLLKNGAHCSVDKDHPDWVKKKQEIDFVHTKLYEICDEYGLWYPEDEYDNTLPKDFYLIQGGAKGVDDTALDWAVVNFCDGVTFKADWDKFGKSAGFIRNNQMLNEGKPDLVVAFPGGKGTKMMVELAKKAGVPVKEYTYVPQ